jgi:excisionase family DNA binding protein
MPGRPADLLHLKEPDPGAAVPRLALRQHEAAKCLGITSRTLRAWDRAGKVRSIAVGRARLYPVAELQAFLQSAAGRPAETA